MSSLPEDGNPYFASMSHPMRPPYAAVPAPQLCSMKSDAAYNLQARHPDKPSVAENWDEIVKDGGEDVAYRFVHFVKHSLGSVLPSPSCSLQQLRPTKYESIIPEVTNYVIVYLPLAGARLSASAAAIVPSLSRRVNSDKALPTTTSVSPSIRM